MLSSLLVRFSREKDDRGKAKTRLYYLVRLTQEGKTKYVTKSFQQFEDLHAILKEQQKKVRL